MKRIGSKSYHIMGFGINSAESSGSTTRELALLCTNRYCVSAFPSIVEPCSWIDIFPRSVKREQYFFCSFYVAVLSI